MAVITSVMSTLKIIVPHSWLGGVRAWRQTRSDFTKDGSLRGPSWVLL